MMVLRLSLMDTSRYLTMRNNTATILQADIKWPCHLNSATKDSLLSIARPYDLANLKNRIPGIFYVASGCLVGYATNQNMDNSLGLVFGAGCWFGIQAINNPDYKRKQIYETLHPTELWVFPREELERLLEQHLEIYKFLFYIAQKTSSAVMQLGSNTLYCLTTRVTYILLELAEKASTVHDDSIINITQQHLSQIAGISRPRVNEVLNDLARCGEIRIGRREIALLNIDALRERLPF